MDPTTQLAPYFQYLDVCSTSRWFGRVTKAAGHLVESEGPFCCVGECCEIVDSEGHVSAGEVIGFRGANVLSMPLERLGGIRYGDRIMTWGAQPTIRVGEELLGRVIDAMGRPLDSLPDYRARDYRPIHALGPPPLDRLPIREALATGIRAIDAVITCGRGQRLGIFGGSGVGKSTLVGMMTRGSAADLAVLGLVGERGREVREFLEGTLGEEGRKRSVVVVSTSDQSPLLRIRAALTATAVAEYFCARGKQVLLVVDSLTRFAMAQREIGLAAGEPPTAKGYTPSVFSLLAQLLERVGRFDGGSITAFYTVLMEGDDQLDPLVDSVRALVDGHIVLDRKLTSQAHFPPIGILDSLSRLMPAVCTRPHLEKASRLRRLAAAYAASEDTIRVGAYQKGLDPILDQALAILPSLTAFLQQRHDEKAPFNQTLSALQAMPA
jgi:flagellum-specific ATP synthase